MKTKKQAKKGRRSPFFGKNNNIRKDIKGGGWLKSPRLPKDLRAGDSYGPKPSASHHDKFFKQAFTEPDLARGLVRLILTSEELQDCNLKSLKVEEKLSKAKKMDLILSFSFKNFPKQQIQLLILVEHKSHYSKKTFKQMLTDQTLLHVTVKKPTLLIPVVFYHGKTPWKYKISFQKAILGDFFEKIPPSFRKGVLDYKARFIDLKHIKDKRMKEFLKKRNAKTSSTLQVLDRSSFFKDSKKEIRELFFGFVSNIKKEKLIVAFAEYWKALGISPKQWKRLEREALKKGLLTKGGHMDIREDFRREGWEKSRQEVIVNMLREKADIAFISKVTGFSLKEIKKLKKNGS